MELEARKLYVGGLPPSTQQDELMDHFGRYGEVLCVRVVRNHETGLGRGFAFVEFADDEGPRAALKEEEKDSHVFGGRTVDVKRARVRPMRYQSDQPFYMHYAYPSPVHSQWYHQSSSNNSYAANGYRGSDPNKVFVGGLRGHITKEDLKSYFEKFGTIIDVVVIHDGLTHKSRGFGFITFDSEEAMLKVLENSFHDLNGTKVETKVAIPKDRYYYDQDRRQQSPMIWGGVGSSMGFPGVYPPNNMQYIVNNHYMVPFQQYMYSPNGHGDYGYGGGVSPSVAAMMTRQSTPVYSYGTQYSGSDNKLHDIEDLQQVNEKPLDLEAKNIPATVTTS
ncbi:RNA-binding protein 1-like [Lolium rigidum]|uniref:RNA-binding protein 1-like n=1 Tax=Lolium rigidum TaxID=89674 RepID=UPI001F5CBE08|nr:RNA-binding protein 1-like [Lolium rigidum]